jgi:hypothetical protein
LVFILGITAPLLAAPAGERACSSLLDGPAGLLWLPLQ